MVHLQIQVKELLFIIVLRFVLKFKYCITILTNLEKIFKI